MRSSFFSLLSCGFSIALLSACASGGGYETARANQANSSAKPVLESERVSPQLKAALSTAEANGDTKQVIAILEEIVKADPNDAIMATRYARELREEDQLNKATRILRPYVEVPKPHYEALTEMAMINLAQGDYASAKNYALKSTVINPKNARGFLALGTAQDALKDHANAEQSFRQGLKYWKGDPAPILNNLALNLASQGHLQESLSLLERAVEISPKRMELERNRRIISTLLETSSPMAPSPSAKPAINIPDTAKPEA